MLSEQYRKMRYLVIDDFESFRQIMTRMLHEIGVDQISEVADAKSAIRFCEQVPFDIILSDYNLGKNKNGQQFLEELHHRKLIKQTSIFIMITAEVSKDSVLTALECQPDSYLTKPFAVATLEKRLEKLLAKNAHLKDILTALDKDDLVAAIEHCDIHLGTSKLHANWCLKTKAELLFRIEDYSGALKIHQDVLSARELDWALLGQGKIYYKTGKYMAAISTLKKLIHKNILCLNAYDWLTKSYQRLGDSESAQRVIQKAVSLSSLSAPRQQFYAEVCRENDDLEQATKAFRKTVALAENSIHYSVDNGLNLARCMTESAEKADPNLSRTLVNDVMGELEKLSKEFDTCDLTLQTKLIQSRAYCAINQEEKAQQALNEARELQEGLGVEMSSELKLEFALTYGATDDKEEELRLLKELAKEPELNEKIAAQIDRMADEPLTATGIERARHLNDQGIEYYKNDQYTKAISQFSMALKQYPKNILFMLNLITALISKIDNNGQDQEHEQRCRQLLAKTEYLAKAHKNYQWRLKLIKQLDVLTQ